MILVAPAVERDVLRLREEFTSLPGLTLTTAQTARLLAVREVKAAKMLAGLEEEGFLECSATGTYFRPGRTTGKPVVARHGTNSCGSRSRIGGVRIMSSKPLLFGPERGCPLSTLEEGTAGIIVRIEPDGGDRIDRLLALGLTPGATVKVLRTFPKVVFLCDQAELAVECAIADLIFVKPEDDW